MSAIELQFFYDYVSPFSFLADRELPAIAAEASVAISYRPIGVLGVMKLVGNTPTTACAAKLHYQLSDVQRWAQLRRVPLRLNPHVAQLDGRSLTRVALQVLGRPEFAALHRRVFDALWLEEVHWPDAQSLEQWLVNEAGLPDAVKLTEDARGVELLRNANADAAEAGVFGVPTVRILAPDRAPELFFGNDRLPFIQRYLRELAGVR